MDAVEKISDYKWIAKYFCNDRISEIFWSCSCRLDVVSRLVVSFHHNQSARTTQKTRGDRYERFKLGSATPIYLRRYV